MITLPNGHSFEYMAASGALGFDGKGWPWERPLEWLNLLDPSHLTIVIKTLTAEPRVGNLNMWHPWTCVRLLRGGTLNAVGLTNPGIDWWCRTIGPTIKHSPLSLVGSILGEPRELELMTRKLNQFGALKALEVNASCPNTKGDILTNTGKVIEGLLAVRNATTLPLILKLSVVHDIPTIVRAVERYVDAFSINSVPWSVVFPSRQSPLTNLGGGAVSGWLVQQYTWPLVEQLKTLTKVPVIGPSVWDYEDIERLRKRGADAIGFGSIFLSHPTRPTSFIRRDQLERSRN